MWLVHFPDAECRQATGKQKLKVPHPESTDWDDKPELEARTPARSTALTPYSHLRSARPCGPHLRTPRPGSAA